MKQSGEVPRAAGFHLTYPSLFSISCKIRSNAVTVLWVNRRRVINDRSELEVQSRPFCQVSTDHLTGYAKGLRETGTGLSCQHPGGVNRGLLLEAESNSQETKFRRDRKYVYMYKNAFAELQALLKGFAFLRVQAPIHVSIM